MAAPGFDFLEGTALDKCCAEFWAAEEGALSDEQKFRRVMLQLLDVARRKVCAGELESAKREWDYFRWAEIHCSSEPLASTFDYGSCLFFALAGDAALQRGRYEQCLQQVELINVILVEGDQRRRWLSLPERLNTEARLNGLRLLAELKWLRGIHDPHIRDRVFTPESMLQQLSVYTTRVKQRLLAEPDSPHAHWMLETAGWAGISSLKVALRWLRPELVSDHLSAYNAAHGTMLSLDHGSLPQGGGLADIWMWEWEIAKAYCSGKLTPLMLADMQSNCLALAAACIPDLVCYMQGLQRESEMYTGQLRTNLVVVTGRS